MSAATNVLDGERGFLGGIFSQGTDAAQRVKSAA